MSFGIRASTLCILLCVTGCKSWRPLLPPTLAVVGGGAGALGGPVSAAVGAGAGSAAGHLVIMDDEKREDKKVMVEALTSGDVQQLVDHRLEKAKDEGFFDSILTEVYGVIKLTAIGLMLWFVVPMIYTHWRAKKTEKKWKQN